jgi:GntR family transcriptional regulator
MTSDITTGRFGDPGAWLPSRSDLADQYEVSRSTITSALGLLDQRHVIEQVPGRGARVALRGLRLPADSTKSASYEMHSSVPEVDEERLVDGERGFRVAQRSAGYETWEELSPPREVEAPSEVAVRLGVPVGTQVLERAGVHGIEDQGTLRPVMLSWAWTAAPEGDQAGLELHWEVVATARAAQEVEAERLGLGGQAPVLEAWRRCFDEDNRILEVTRRVIDSSGYDLVIAFGG